VAPGERRRVLQGTPNGTFNEIIALNGAAQLETPEFMAQHIDGFRTPAAYNDYAVGWAHAMNTPYQWTKQVASHFGGTRTGAVVHWPNRFKARGEVRPQFHHLIDVAPTILAAAGLPEPTFVNGIQQMPLHGASMAYAFDEADAPEARVTQYFEVPCNRGIDHKGWTAGTRHSTPWSSGASCPHSTTMRGSSTTRAPTGRRRMTSPISTRTGSRSFSACG
jgi:arylsulfatase A-like enzyme